METAIQGIFWLLLAFIILFFFFVEEVKEFIVDIIKAFKEN